MAGQGQPTPPDVMKELDLPAGIPGKDLVGILLERASEIRVRYAEPPGEGPAWDRAYYS